MPAIADAFSDYFDAFQVELPPGPLEAGDSGHIYSDDGWDVRYVVESGDDGIHLDFYAVHRMTNPQHVRIHADGTVEPLPSPQDVVIYPPNATDEERRQADAEREAHNRVVTETLRRKGLIGDS